MSLFSVLQASVLRTATLSTCLCLSAINTWLSSLTVDTCGQACPPYRWAAVLANQLFRYLWSITCGMTHRWCFCMQEKLSDVDTKKTMAPKQMLWYVWPLVYLCSYLFSCSPVEALLLHPFNLEFTCLPRCRRPKSQQPSVVLMWDRLLLVVGVCNETIQYPSNFTSEHVQIHFRCVKVLLGVVQSSRYLYLLRGEKYLCLYLSKIQNRLKNQFFFLFMLLIYVTV